MVLCAPKAWRKRASAPCMPRAVQSPVSLAEGPEGTILSYDVQANVGGKIAQLGSRLIDGVAKKTADAFFANFAAAVAK